MSAELFSILQSKWGCLDVDWFASEHNAKLERFYTRFWCEKSSGVDSFAENWGGCNDYFVPPISLICKTILHMKKCKAFGVLVIPWWESAPFWPLLCDAKDDFSSFVCDWLELPTGKKYYLPCKSDEGLFGNEDLNFRMIAIRLCFR